MTDTRPQFPYEVAVYWTVEQAQEEKPEVIAQFTTGQYAWEFMRTLNPYLYHKMSVRTAGAPTMPHLADIGPRPGHVISPCHQDSG